MPLLFSRRQAIGALAASAAAPTPGSPQLIRRHDEAVARYLQRQVTDPKSRWCGGMPDETGLHHPGNAGGIFNALTLAYLHPASKYHHDNALVPRMKLAAAHLERAQTKDGNVDLLVTNFNSPPDTGFVVWPVAQAASVARRHQKPDIAAIVEPFLKKAGAAMARGGIHTPNHRWVVSSALSQINELWPDASYTRRINQWLAEGIDIDADGQYTERSTLVYNMVCNRAFILLAAKLGKKELLEPVRRNLESLLYLLHADGEVVTEISRRQDLNMRGKASGYWLALAYLAVHTGDGRFATLAREFEAEHASLGDLMDLPELSQPLPKSAPLPDDYEKMFGDLKVARIRRKATSATLLLNGATTFFNLHRGSAVINGVRFASAFFGKGQFAPTQAEKRGSSYVFTQTLEAGYYQPLDPAKKVPAGEWSSFRGMRKRTELCGLTQSATVTETPKGFRIRIQAQGTPNVPLAVEISLREGGKLEGCVPAPKAAGSYLLKSGKATYRTANGVIRFGPGYAEHGYVEVRGAEAKLPGTSVYLTGYTPFDHTFDIEVEG